MGYAFDCGRYARKGTAVALSAVLALSGAGAVFSVESAYALENTDPATAPEYTYRFSVSKVEAVDSTKSVVLHIDGMGIRSEAGWWYRVSDQIQNFQIDGVYVRDFKNYVHARCDTAAGTLTLTGQTELYDMVKKCGDKHQVVVNFTDGAGKSYRFVKEDAGYVAHAGTPGSGAEDPGLGDRKVTYYIMNAARGDGSGFGNYKGEFYLYLNEGVSTADFVSKMKEVYINGTKVTDPSIFTSSALHVDRIHTNEYQREAYNLWHVDEQGKTKGDNKIKVVLKDGTVVEFDEQNKPDPKTIPHVSYVSLDDIDKIEIAGSNQICIELKGSSSTKKNYFFNEIESIDVNGVELPIKEFHRGMAHDICSVEYGSAAEGILKRHNEAWNKNAENPVVVFHLKDKTTLTWPKGAVAPKPGGEAEVPGEGGNQAAKQAEWVRLAGDDAFGTMKSITSSAHGWADGSCKTVVLATSSGYWDALSAAALAGAHKAPVLITDASSLTDQTASEIRRLGAEKVVICGGEAAVSAEVERAVKGLGAAVERAQGEDAQATAVEIAKRVRAQAKPTTCIVATSAGYYDALSVSPWSYSSAAPIYLTDAEGNLGEAALADMKAAGYTRAVIVGGTAAIADGTEAKLAEALGTAPGSVSRIAGQDAWQTSAAIAKAQIEADPTCARTVGVADGNGYWDALTGGALIGKANGVMLLVPHDGPTSEGGSFSYDAFTIENVIKKHADAIERAFVFGGEAAVPASTMDAARDAEASK
ncbi:cell wall-binding repeat-containing protein [Berryella intestinalis]|uniref:cell wall-binding repeat-containing protein n=1 Tax=Berryella intestinalis TaxID=1531429 RepID=UPI00057F09AA|nr:cell wall-binding repeat-containing protein [Berryella intestinalis]